MQLLLSRHLLQCFFKLFKDKSELEKVFFYLMAFSEKQMF